MDFLMEYIHQLRDIKMKNPFHRFVVASTGEKIDVNMNTVMNFQLASDQSGTVMIFTNGERLEVKESPRTVRGAARKTWPDQTTTTDHIVDGEAA